MDATAAAPPGRITWLRARLRSIEADLADARQHGSRPTVAALHREARIVRGELDEAVLASAAAAAAAKARTASVTELDHAVLAAQLSEADLDVYLSEFLSRRRLGATLDSDGTPVLYRLEQHG